MKHLKLLGLALIAISLLGAVASSIAPAEEGGAPSVLPEPTEKNPVRYNIVSNLSTFRVGMTPVVCLKDKGTGQINNNRLGTEVVDYEGCKTGTLSCNTPGDAVGVILMNYDTHLTATLLPNKELVLEEVSKLPEAVAATCGVTKDKIRGADIGLLKGPKTLVKTKSANLSLQTEKEGKTQVLKECELDKEFCFEGGVHKKFLLESSVGESEFEEAAEEGEEEITFEKEIEFHF